MIVTNPFSSEPWAREQIDRVSRGWWVLLITGVVSVVAGGIVLFTNWTVADLAAFAGAVFVVRGVFTMLGVPVDGAARGWAITGGLLEVGLGIAVWSWPGPTLLVLAVWVGWWVLFSGLMTIGGALTGRGVLPYWGLIMAFGILETFFSFWLLARPALTLVAVVLAIGLWSMFYGVVQVVLAFEVKNLVTRIDRVSRDLVDRTSTRSFDSALR